jgi:ADP-ribose pyrophosphatase YjhB (NUDIX family)
VLEALKVAVYRALPERLRGPAVRWGTPNYTVGASGLVTDGTGRLLLVRLTYRDGWWPPGGFLAKGETAEVGLTRECEEELGLTVRFSAPHRVFHDPDLRWVTFVCVGLASAGLLPMPRGPEVAEARWFALDDLPPRPKDFREGITDADKAAVRTSTP